MDIKIPFLLLTLLLLVLLMFVEECNSEPSPKKNEADYHYHKESHKNKHKNRHKHRHGHKKKKHRRSGKGTILTDPVSVLRRNSLLKTTRLGSYLLGEGSSQGAGSQVINKPAKATVTNRQSPWRPQGPSGERRPSGSGLGSSPQRGTSFGDGSSLAADFNAPDMQFAREETGGEFATGLNDGGEFGEPGFEERSNDNKEFATGFGNDYQVNYEEYTGPYTASGDIYRYEGYKK